MILRETSGADSEKLVRFIPAAVNLRSRSGTKPAAPATRAILAVVRKEA
jgi:hypothetical protein